MKIGTFPLSHVPVDLFLDPPSEDGAFYFNPDCKSPSRIRIGRADSWDHLVGVLVHEAMEAALSLQNVRFVSDSYHFSNSAGYYFMFDHNVLTAVCSSVGEFLAAALPPLAKAYNRKRKR